MHLQRVFCIMTESCCPQTPSELVFLFPDALTFKYIKYLRDTYFKEYNI